MNENIIGRFSKKLDSPKVVVALLSLITLLMLLISNLLLKTALSLILTIKNQDLSFLYQIKFTDFFKFEVIRYPKFYLLALILISIFNVKIIYKLRNNFGNIVKGQKGTSEFTSIKELREQYIAVPEKEKEYEGSGGVPISREGKKIYIDDSPVNNLIIGTTRSGKGETFVFPSIDVYSRAKEKASMIVNDPKGELVSASYDSLIKRGYDVQVLNLLEPLDGMYYNPLQLIIDAYKNKEYSKAQTLCNTLTFSLYNDSTAKDKFWQTSAQSLVNAIILALTHDFIERKEEEKITMYAVANFLSEYGSKEDKKGNNALDDFFQNRSSYDVAKMQYATSNFAKGTTRGGIFASAMVSLQIFTFEEIAKMTSRNSCNLSDVGFGDKPVAIFMVVPDYDASNHVIASIFVRQLYYILAQKASLSDGQKCTRKVKFILDEVGNMPPIEGLANIITVCLGRNISFDLIIQSYSQLNKLYGEDKNTIVGNCGNQIYILTNDLDTAEHFSKLIGYKTIISNSRSGKTLSLDKSQTEGVDKRELLTPNELMSLKEGESVVVRVIKRQDKNRNKITPKPIFNTGKTTLKYRYEYLAKDLDTNNNVIDIKIKIFIAIAKDLVNALPESEEKIDLEKRLNKLQQELETERVARIDKKTKEDEFEEEIKKAKGLFELLFELPDEFEKEELQNELIRIQNELKDKIQIKNAVTLIKRAEKDISIENIVIAEKQLHLLAKGDIKEDLQEKLNNVNEKLLKLPPKTEEVMKVEESEKDEKEESKEKETNQDMSLQNQLNEIQDKIYYKNQIHIATKAVEKAEKGQIQENIDITNLIYKGRNKGNENIDNYDNEIEEEIELSSQNHILVSMIFKNYPELSGMDTSEINKNILKEIIELDEISDKDKNIIKEKILEK